MGGKEHARHKLLLQVEYLFMSTSCDMRLSAKRQKGKKVPLHNRHMADNTAKKREGNTQTCSRVQGIYQSGKKSLNPFFR